MRPVGKIIIISVVVLSIFLTSVPKANAFVTDWNFVSLKVKQYWDLWRGIRGELNKISGAINRQILEGDKTQNPNGEPAYIEYWRDFIGESMFRGENVFRAEYEGTPVCSYLKEDLQLIYGISEMDLPDGSTGLPPAYDTKAATARVHPFELANRCTMATIEGADSDDGSGDKDKQLKFLEDWINSSDPMGSYLELSQTQNNFIGAYLNADNEFEGQSIFEKEKDVLDALANAGFWGIKDTGNVDEPGCLKDTQGRCIVLGKTVTPGKVLAEAAAKVITAEFDLITSRNEGHFRSVLNSLMERFLNFNTSTGYEGDLEGIGTGTISLVEEEGTGFETDFRDAANYSACVRDCEVDNPPKKAEGCTDTGGKCLKCVDFRGEGEDGIECNLWQTVECEGISTPENCDINDINYKKRAQCIEDCNRKFIFGDAGDEEGRCGVNYPTPECVCEGIDPSVTYTYATSIRGVQESLAGQSCSADIGIICDDLGPHGLGRLEGGLNVSSAAKYMDALITAINAGTNLDASYHFVGVEPILGVFDGEKTEYYDVITSNGNVWNNMGKVVCTPKSPLVSGPGGSSSGEGGGGGGGSDDEGTPEH